MRLEQVEENLPQAEDLREVTSVDEREIETFAATIDPSGGTLKIRSGKQTVDMPRSPEELRLRHRRIGLSWDFIAARHHRRAWIAGSVTDAFRKFSDWILGSHIAGIKTSDGRTPSWSLILNFEKEARGKMYESVRDGSAATVKDAIDMIFKRAILSTHIWSSLSP